MSHLTTTMAGRVVSRAFDDGIPPGYVPIDDEGHYMYFWDTRVCFISPASPSIAVVLYLRASPRPQTGLSAKDSDTNISSPPRPVS